MFDEYETSRLVPIFEELVARHALLLTGGFDQDQCLPLHKKGGAEVSGRTPRDPGSIDHTASRMNRPLLKSSPVLFAWWMIKTAYDEAEASS